MPKNTTPVDLKRVTIAVPVIGPVFRTNTELIRFLDNNITCTHTFYGGNVLRSYIVTNQSRVFTYPSKKNVFVGVDVHKPDSTTARATTAWIRDNTYTPLNIRRIDEDTFTELPEYLTERLDVVSISDLANKNEANNFIKNAPMLPANSTYDLIRGRGSSKSQGLQIAQQKLYVETIGSFSLLGDLDKKKQDKILNVLPTKLVGIKVSKFFKGKSGPNFKVQEVTRSDIASGSAFFLFKTPVTIIDPLTSTISIVDLICLGSMWDAKKVKRFKKARAAMLELLPNLQQNPMKLLEPKKYQDLAQQKLGDFCKFWGGIAEIIEPDMVPNDFHAPDYDEIDLTLQNDSYIDNQAYKALGAHNYMSATIEGKKLKRSARALSSARNVVNQTEYDKNLIEKNKIKITNSIKKVEEDQKIFLKWVQQSKETIENHNQEIKEREEEIEEMLNKIQILQEGLTKLKKNHGKSIKTYEEKLKEYLDSEGTKTDFFQNMLKSGVLISNIELRNLQTKEICSLKENLHLVGNEDWVFARVELLTTRPTPIYVDKLDKGEKAEVVYGGPYKILISSAGEEQKVKMMISLASLNSVFGFKPFDGRFKAKVHPHCPPQDVYQNLDSIIEFIREQWPTCLGDAESTIQQGFQSHNVKMVIAGALSWLSSAYSSDQWGSQWNWFPQEDDINLAGSWTNEDNSDSQTLSIESSLAEMQKKLATNNPIQTTTNSSPTS